MDTTVLRQSSIRTALTVVVAGAALLVTSSLHGQPTEAQTNGPMIPSELWRLENGLSVVLSRDTSIPVASTYLCFHVGSANERPGRTGLAHLLEHLMASGTENVEKGDFSRQVTEAGGSRNAWTSRDFTCYVATVPSNFLEMVLWHEADRMTSFVPALTPEKVDVEIDVVQNERREVFDNAPYGLAYERLHAAIYPPGHPYRQVQIGAMADIGQATVEDVRSFFQTYYAPGNAVLTIVGDFDPAILKPTIALYFGSVPPGDSFERPDLPSVRLEETHYEVLEDRVGLPELRVAWPSSVRFEEDDPSLEVLARILGAGRSSRLFRRLVHEEQVAQTVSTTQFGETYGRLFQVVVRARAGIDLDRILQILDEEVENLRRTPPDEREVRRAINGVEAGYFRSLETLLSRASQLSLRYLATGDPGYTDRELAALGAVTPMSVQDVARRYLGPGRVVLSVVPVDRPDLQASPGSSDSN